MCCLIAGEESIICTQFFICGQRKVQIEQSHGASERKKGDTLTGSCYKLKMHHPIGNYEDDRKGNEQGSSIVGYCFFFNAFVIETVSPGDTFLN